MKLERPLASRRSSYSARNARFASLAARDASSWACQPVVGERGGDRVAEERQRGRQRGRRREGGELCVKLLTLSHDLVDLSHGRDALDRGRAGLDVDDQLPEVALRARRLGKELVQVGERLAE
jgi:hypothetical protein